ncbi:MIP family channel protein [Olivibacter sp. SDN3]|uniref:MIP/aquaporin family protein n=1 Tax=Olivibacter sp. SDN3 TaxID=2764720 RepID=UPI001651AD56|nr:MIP family channel protein [Olivibacter sp. SDN3]QNL50570.1 MIP family channel protein [Olivibacter sp. SDN3]
MNQIRLSKQCIAEFLATFILVFCGTGAIVINDETGGTISHLGIAMTFGLVVMCLIYVFGHISGAHMNPAVSIAFVLTRQLPKKMLLPYVGSQLLGALSASIFLKGMFPANELLGATIPRGAVMQSFYLEIILTFFLMLTVLHLLQKESKKLDFIGVVVGAVVGLEAMFAGPISGASMNPARSFGPAVVSGEWNTLWVYLSAPVIGASLAVPTAHFFHKIGFSEKINHNKRLLKEEVLK